MNNFYSPKSENTEITPKYSSSEMMKMIELSLRDILDKMEDGERTTLQDVIDKVAASTKLKISSVGGIVKLYIAGSPDAYIKQGRTGGVIKGVERERIDMRPRCETCNQVWRDKPVDLDAQKLAAAPISEPARPTATEKSHSFSFPTEDDVGNFFDGDIGTNNNE